MVLVIMETPVSFAPLAARLAAHVVTIRPVEGSRDDWSKVMALVMCAVLEMFICLCEALDARALAGLHPVALAPRDTKAASVPALRSGLHAPPGARRVRSPSLPTEVRAVAPLRVATSSEIAEAIYAGPSLAWSRNPGPSRAVVAAPWQPSEKRAFAPGFTHAYIVTISL